MSIKYRGFASIEKDKQRLIAGRGGKSAHAQGKAHEWTKEEAGKAGRVGGRKPRRTTGIYNMSPATRRAKLLKLLQDFLHQHPAKPVSFIVLANELGCSRQYIRDLYHQLKTDYPVPPIRARHLVAKD